MIGVIDYEAGNLRSVETALHHIGADFRIIRDPDDVASMDKVIFPGVGQAGSAMAVLDKTGLGQALQSFFKSGKPLLGICLGSQIVLKSSDEGNVACLGLADGYCRHFSHLFGNSNVTDRGVDVGIGGYFVDGVRLKVPHMGWNSVNWNTEDSIARALFAGIPQGASFYFVHSYYTEPANSTKTLCSSTYGLPFSAGISQDNLAAFQFHPEKSGRWGLCILQNFMEV